MNTVLLVDDDNAVLFAFRKLCAASGVSAETAESLKSALWLLSHGRYDVLIADLSLTGSSGQEGFRIVREAKRFNPLIRAYIWTAYDEHIARDKAAETDIIDILIKPVKFEMILSIINDRSAADAFRAAR
jgi:DNA-binding NtrC family response regulator